MTFRHALLALLFVAALAPLACLGDADEDAPLTLYGTVDVRELALAFRLPGRLASLEVEEGDVVDEGDEVARLDDGPYRDDLAAAEARVEVARAHLARLLAGSRPQEIQQAEAAVTEAEARVRAAEQELERKLGLLAPGAASEREVEAARERHDAAVARRDAAREALDLAREGFRDEDVAAGRAELRRAEAELERARTALDDTRLVAPSRGTVTTRVHEPGAVLATGSPVAALTLHEPLVVRAYVAEPHLGHVAPGTRVEITTDSSAEVFHGVVGFVSPQAEFTPKTVATPDLRTDLVYRLRIVVDRSGPTPNLHPVLRQGMPVTVTVPRDADPEPPGPDGD